MIRMEYASSTVIRRRSVSEVGGLKVSTHLQLARLRIVVMMMIRKNSFDFSTWFHAAESYKMPLYKFEPRSV